MPTLTIRNLDVSITDGLKALSAEHGRSMEAEARLILANAVAPIPPGEYGLASRIRAKLEALDAGVDIELPERSLQRELPGIFDQ